MIKYLKYMFLAAITLMAATGCQEDQEDTFSMDPIAPVLVSNGSILMTQNTMSEPIKWSWSAARNTQGVVNYALFAEYQEETPVQVGNSTTELYLSMGKTEFRTLLEGIASIPENASFDISFYVTATDENGTYSSEKMVTTVYSYGNAVPATITPEATEVILDSENPDAELTLLSWEAARLNYNEAITYRLDATRADNGMMATVATDLTETVYSTSVQAWNEFCVKSLGLPEATASDVQLTVTAFSESYPDGVPSPAVTISVTTYELPYPKEEYIYIPGDHQNWDPATAPRLRSANLDGIYTGFCYLSGGFKFTKQPTWDEEYNSSHFPNMGDNLSDSSGNIAIDQPGFYYLVADVMTGTLTATLTNTWGIVGNQTNWADGADLLLTWDAAKGCWSGTLALEAGEMKFRADGAWDISVGGSFDDLTEDNGGNLIIETADTYFVELYLQRTDSEKMYAKLTPQ